MSMNTALELNCEVGGMLVSNSRSQAGWANIHKPAGAQFLVDRSVVITMQLEIPRPFPILFLMHGPCRQLWKQPNGKQGNRTYLFLPAGVGGICAKVGALVLVWRY